jgi:hypothetical protein
LFLKDLSDRKQTIKFSGVGAHHQNGIAERAIRTVSESARAMILHAAIHWPEAVTIDLWPFAVDYAVYLWNRMPRKDNGIAPLEIFCGGKIHPKVIRGAHVWGCPTYVLDPMIQDGKKLPRWQPKSRRAQFLGFSKRHASTIGLVRNLKTGAISPQFHVVYDDTFTTVPSRVRDDDINPPANWLELLTFSRVNLLDADDDNVPMLADDWLTDEELAERRRRQNQPAPPIRRNEPEVTINNNNRDESDDEIPDFLPPYNDEDDESDDEDVNESANAENNWKPRRRWKPNPRYYGDDFVNTTNLNRADGFVALLNDFGSLSDEEVFLANLGTEKSQFESSQLRQMRVLESFHCDEDGLLSLLHPLAFAARANNCNIRNLNEV